MGAMAWTLAAVLVALVALGGKVALHLLRGPHPHPSPAIRKARVAILVLVACGQGAMTLQLLSLITGHAFHLLGYLLGRGVEPVCLLLFVNACLAICHQEHVVDEEGGAKCRRRHPYCGTALAKEDQAPGSGKTMTPPAPAPAVGRKLLRGSRGLGGFLAFIRGCLYVMTVAVFVDTLLQPGIYPCSVTSGWLPSGPSAPARTLAGRDLGKGSASPARLYDLGDASQQTADLAATAANEEVDRLWASLRSSAETNRSPSIFLYHGWAKQLPREGMCVSDFGKRFLLDGVFNLVLLLYLACSILWLQRHALLSNIANGSTSMSENGGTVIKQDEHTVDEAQHFSLRQNQCSSKETTQNNAVRTCDDSLQPSFAPISIKADAFAAASERRDVDNANPLKTAAWENKPPLAGGVGDDLLSTLKIVDETDAVQNSHSATLPTSTVGGSNANSEAQLRMSVIPAIAFGRTEAAEHCFRVAPGESESEGGVDLQEECNVCRQVAPYVPLATLVLLVQHVLVLPLWDVFAWSKDRQVMVPPPAALFLPIYCAVCFVFRACMNAER